MELEDPRVYVVEETSEGTSSVMAVFSNYFKALEFVKQQIGDDTAYKSNGWHWHKRMHGEEYGYSIWQKEIDNASL